ncbi:hypothetical protein BGZ67_005717 [Mortierella alpina]|nr:hypothetical protein BGZ67_005717 [Mortierella alpina]
MDLDKEEVAEQLDVSPVSVKIWTGAVYSDEVKLKKPGWRREVQGFVLDYVQKHPCFLLGDLPQAIQETFEDLRTVPIEKICGTLRHDINLSRRKLKKLATDKISPEREYSRQRLSSFYNIPEPLDLNDM